MVGVATHHYPVIPTIEVIPPDEHPDACEDVIGYQVHSRHEEDPLVHKTLLGDLTLLGLHEFEAFHHIQQPEEIYKPVDFAEPSEPH